LKLQVPVIDKNNSMAAVEKDNLVSLWPETVLSPMNIYDRFLFSVDPRLQYIEPGEPDQGELMNYYKHVVTWYELDNQTDDTLTQALKKLYPDLYRPLLDASDQFL
jgi:hypothetical protein